MQNEQEDYDKDRAEWMLTASPSDIEILLELEAHAEWKEKKEYEKQRMDEKAEERRKCIEKLASYLHIDAHNEVQLIALQRYTPLDMTQYHFAPPMRSSKYD